jgi:hypothetical protein
MSWRATAGAIGGSGRGASVEVHHDSGTVTVHLPLKLHRRGGRKLIMTADGSPLQPTAFGAAQSQGLSPLVKALARAFRWRKLLEDGVYASCAELAVVEKINPSYVSRVLRLSLLAPEITEAILNRGQSALHLDALMQRCPVTWIEQRDCFTPDT